MDSITLQNYRCFREEQTARLAPLTLLVGENSTGKTSFLALVRALWDIAFQNNVPNFQEEPYNLGAFRDITHKRSSPGGQADSFEAGFEYHRPQRARNRRLEGVSFRATFEDRRGSPFPVTRSLYRRDAWLEAHDKEDGGHLLRFGTGKSNEEYSAESNILSRDDDNLVSFRQMFWDINRGSRSDEPSTPNEKEIEDLVSSLSIPPSNLVRERPFASAPVRTRPRRTYDPTRPSRDPEGEYIPTYLASEFHRGQTSWKELKSALEQFGQNSGLFDEINVKSLGKTEGTPFQLEVRKFGKRTKGPPRNLIDVGYGVSQALPILTELLRPDSSAMFLLQQPEVHLHPMAQAALGSLFCSIARPNRQLIVETHSDYIIDRVRMDIRDKKSPLKPEDVSILYFEPGELEVNIRSIRLDDMGNVLDAPPGYGQFFMEEVRRSVGMGIRA